ncbi:hypothetical protein E0493_22780 [Roseomonas sp. M0104]|uniref:Ketohydroxyglutarate aldolase n=1 Tax=Teichococcus coralli TaxID=2545983 RepID=A0A845BJ01_9PROT|nr:hypothetical protein [Pseudoroseomonas coralli]MXP66156.1 hypothetical protein [Pseudoroseomonas coralli]
MQMVRVTMSVPDPGQFDEVLRAAEAHGLKIEKSFPSLGVATGAAPTKAVEALRSLPGVGSIESERTYRIAKD